MGLLAVPQLQLCQEMKPMRTAHAARTITCRGQPSAVLRERPPAGTSPAAAVQRPAQPCWPVPAPVAGPPGAPLLPALHGSHLEPAMSQPVPQSPRTSATTARVKSMQHPPHSHAQAGNGTCSHSQLKAACTTSTETCSNSGVNHI